MKKIPGILLILFILILSEKGFSQTNSDMREFGISFGSFTNFPANQNYLKNDISVIYLTPYIRLGKSEISAGVLYPVATKGLFFNNTNINSRMGATAGYKFYLFNVYGRENLFVHYSFQYIRFMGNFNGYFNGSTEMYHMTETDTYINNVIGLGYNLFFDTQGRFGFFYTLDYMISNTNYNVTNSTVLMDPVKLNQNVWNSLSTNFGFLFKITSLKKKAKK